MKRDADGWTGSSGYSVVCSKHFTSDGFEEDSGRMTKFGIEKIRRLKPNALPTVFLRDTGGECSSRKQAGQEVSVPVEKKRMEYKKRERSRVYTDINLHPAVAIAIHSYRLCEN